MVMMSLLTKKNQISQTSLHIQSYLGDTAINVTFLDY